MSNYNLGLVSITFRDKTPEEILSAMKDTGLSFIEWGSDVHAPKDDIERLEGIAALQKNIMLYAHRMEHISDSVLHLLTSLKDI